MDVLVRLVYLLLILAIALPVIFYALAAYQYQVDAAAIAEERDLNVAELLARAAAWNSALHDWTSLVEEGAKAADAADKTAAPKAPAAKAAAEPGAPDGGEAGSVVADDGAGVDDAGAATDGDAAARHTRAEEKIDARVLEAYRDAVAALRARGPEALAPPLPSADDEAVARVLASELQRFDRLLLPQWMLWDLRPSLLAELPGWVLTLVVTLVAGLLGSLIFVLKAMLRQLLDDWSTGTIAPCRPRPWSWLLLRPVFGVVIAFGAYVALQSGLLVIDGAMSLTPSAYVTAAVGLIAGLLSWQVIDTIENVGERWLASQRPVWAYGLKSQITARNTSETALATALGVSKPVLKDWVDVRVPVPNDQAKRLAAELNTRPEQLFQPVPPWRRRDQTSKT